MKKVEVKVNSNLLKLTKETNEQRLERLHTQRTYTRVVESKKVYDRKRDKRSWSVL